MHWLCTFFFVVHFASEMNMNLNLFSLKTFKRPCYNELVSQTLCALVMLNNTVQQS